MPVVRRHSPSAALLGAVAHQAGQGDYAQRRDSALLRAIDNAARLDLGARESDRRYAAAQQAQADNAALRAQHEANRLAVAQADLQARAAREAVEFQRQAAMEQLEQAGQIAYAREQGRLWQQRDQANQQADLQLQEQQQEADMVRDMAAAAALESREAASSLRQMQLTDEGDRLRAPLLREYESLREARSRFSPQAYADLIGQWLGRVNETDWESMVPQEPTTEELFRRHTYRNPEDGRLYAYTLRNGEPSWSELGEPPDPNAESEASPISRKPRTWAQWRNDAISAINAEAGLDGTPDLSDENIRRRAYQLMEEESQADAEYREFRSREQESRAQREQWEAAGAGEGETIQEQFASLWQAALEMGVQELPDGSIQLVEMPDEYVRALVGSAPRGTVFVYPDGTRHAKP